jgi:hypothetical protein
VDWFTLTERMPLNPLSLGLGSKIQEEESACLLLGMIS